MKKTMKTTHRVLSLLLVLAMVFTLLPLIVSAATVASGTCGANVTWVLDDAGTLTISGSGAMTNYEVYYGAPWYNNRSTIKSVVIRNGVTSIGKLAFAHCISLTSVTIPGSVTSIGYAAFFNCLSLTDLTIPNSVTSIGDSVFEFCESLTDLTIPNSVTSIGTGTFANCKSLTDLTIPESVISISNSAFSGCKSLTDLTIPDSVTSISEAAFAATGLSAFVVAEGNPAYKAIDGVLFTTDEKTLMAYPPAKEGTAYTIPDTVTSIVDSAFQSCSSLTSVSIPDSVTSIGDCAFENCRSLTSVTIPDSVTSIGNYAFSSCTALTSVTIPDSVTSIGDYAFRYSGVTDVYTNRTEEEWANVSVGSSAFPTGVYFHYKVCLPGQAPTCTEPGLTEGWNCSCGESITKQETIPATGHNWDEGVVTTDPACESEGVKTFTCGNNAEHTYTEVVSAAGHDYTTVVTAPTCTEQGYTTYTCHCGDSYVADDVDATGHDWDEGVVTTDPACESEGVKTFTCGNDAAHTYTEAVSATGHTEEAVPGKAATCTEDGLTDGSKCGTCGVTLKAQETVIVTCSSADFKDLDAGAWYHGYTDFVIENGYMNGYPGNLFGPEDTLSRAQLVQILYNLEGKPAVSGEDDFADTDPGAWYTDAIFWAAQNDIVVGYGDSKFGPEDLITREQMATIFYRYAQMKGYELSEGDYSAFSDADKVSEFAKVPIGWAVGKGLLVGMDDGTLAPASNTKRAEAAAILTRFIQNIAK